MTLDFEMFETSVMLMTILIVGSVINDGKSNWLEGILLDLDMAFMHCDNCVILLHTCAASTLIHLCHAACAGSILMTAYLLVAIAMWSMPNEE